jgi:hypothetical protein
LNGINICVFKQTGNHFLDELNTDFSCDTILFVFYMQTMGWTTEGSSSCPGRGKIYLDVGFEVFTAMTMKKAVFWDVTPCRSCVNRQNSSPLHDVQTGSGAHPASFPMSTGGKAPGA